MIFPDLVYVGSTTDFYSRKGRHEQDTGTNMTSKLYENIRSNGVWESWEMVKICDYPCSSSTEAKQEEQRHIIELKANLNSNSAHLTDKQRKEKGKPIDPEYFNKYYHEKLSVKEECPVCCELISKSKMKKHQLTKKCINCNAPGQSRCKICNKSVPDIRIKQHLKSIHCTKFLIN